MPEASWSQLTLSDATEEDGVWELFHTNSKIHRHGYYVPDDRVAARMLRMTDALRYEGCPQVALPSGTSQLAMPLGEAIANRVTPMRLEPAAISIDMLAAFLAAGYGVTRTNETTQFLRPFRTVPSGGALYPLEVYVSTKHVTGLGAGLYHFAPPDHGLHLLRSGDLSPDLSDALVEFQSHLAFDAAAMIIITATFRRSTFKYGARGYRFALLEAGHLAQNINLAVTSLGLGCFNIGGFYDQAVDRFLGIDGLNQSTVYMIAIGKVAATHEPATPLAGGQQH